MAQTPFRVVQWTTGNVGKSSVAAIAANPAYELVGCFAWSPDKVGRDAGELAGTAPPLGIRATDSVDELLALKPDVVVYNPMWIDVGGELERILSAGVNVVSTACFITGGHNQGEGRDRLMAACIRGGSTMFGSGISPGSSISWLWWPRESATGSTGSRSTRRPTRRSTIRRTPRNRSDSVSRSTTPPIYPR